MTLTIAIHVLAPNIDASLRFGFPRGGDARSRRARIISTRPRTGAQDCDDSPACEIGPRITPAPRLEQGGQDVRSDQG